MARRGGDFAPHRGGCFCSASRGLILRRTAGADFSPRRGDDFARGYTPALGDLAHLCWAPSKRREMRGSHYALVLSADLYIND